MATELILTQTDIAQVNPTLLLEELETALGFELKLVTKKEADLLLEAIISKKDNTEITPLEEATIFSIVGSHNHENPDSREAQIIQDNLNKDNALLKWSASQLSNKTPDEIFTLIENNIDSWSNLADAQTDLKKWLPVMATIISAIKERLED
jgi:hypothetical protein